MPLLTASDGTCADSRHSSGPAVIVISACLSPTGATPQDFFNMTIALSNHGSADLLLKSGVVYVGSNPFNVSIYNSDGHRLGSFGDWTPQAFSGIYLTAGSSIYRNFTFSALLGVLDRGGPWEPWNNWQPLNLSYFLVGEKPGLYFVQTVLSASISLRGGYTYLFNQTDFGGEIRTPMIAYEVLDPLQPFTDFQILVLSLLSINAVITIFILLNIRRLLSDRSTKLEKPQAKKEQ